MITLRGSTLVLCFAISTALGCSADGAPKHAPDATATVAPDSATATPTAEPTATQSSSAKVVETGAPKSSAHACVMLYECGCNASCEEIDASVKDLKDKLPTRISTGQLAGTKVWVIKNGSATGTIFTLDRTDPAQQGRGCSNQATRSLIAYGCNVSDSGPPRSCTSCSR